MKLNAMLNAIKKSRNKNKNPQISKNHLAHVRGQFSESGSCFDTSTVISVTMKIRGALTMINGFYWTAPATSNVPAKNGDVIR